VTWREISAGHTTTPLPSGVVSVDNRLKTIRFGATTIRAWKLNRFKTVNLLFDDESGLAGLQFLEDYAGTVQFGKHGSSGRLIYCKDLLKAAKAKPGRYKARRETGSFIVVDFRLAKIGQFAPRKGRY